MDNNRQIYPITGLGQTVGDFLENALLDKLRDADSVEYERLIGQNIDVLNGIGDDFFREIFMEGSRDQILFWINTPLRRLSIHDLYVIPFDYDDLFYIGLLRPDFDMEGAENVIEVLEEFLQDPNTVIEKEVVRNRLIKIRNLIANK